MPPSRGEEPPFQNIAIVGFGLIGGSIALAIRERWPSVRITAVDRPPVLAHALGERRDRPRRKRRCRPRQALTWWCLRRRSSRTFVCCLRSPSISELTRSSPMSVAPSETSSKRQRGFPDRGRRSSEVTRSAEPNVAALRFARADLFRGQTVDPHAGRLDRCWDRRAAGSPSSKAWARKPTMMDADEHDRLMAFLSHLPQLTVSALDGSRG